MVLTGAVAQRFLASEIEDVAEAAASATAARGAGFSSSVCTPGGSTDNLRERIGSYDLAAVVANVR
jgi:hypothetical protein